MRQQEIWMKEECVAKMMTVEFLSLEKSML